MWILMQFSGKIKSIMIYKRKIAKSVYPEITSKPKYFMLL